MKLTLRKRLALAAYLALMVLVPCTKLAAQSTAVYTEGFSYPDGTASSSLWTLDASHCNQAASNYHFNVTAQALEGRNLTGEAIWRSSSVAIATYQHVDISLDISRSGSLVSSDYVKTFYILDGGAETPFTTNGNLTGNFVSCSATQNNLTGTTLQIVVRMLNNSAGKKQRVDNVTITGSNPVNIPLAATIATTDENCAGHGNGSATLTVSGGTAPYSYTWSNNNTTQNLADITQGTYTVTITDAANGTITASGTVNALPGMLTALTVHDASPGTSDGLAKIAVSGGSAPYTIHWSNGIANTNNYHLAPGSYSVTVADANQCQTVSTATVNASTATTIINEDFDGLFSNTWQSLSFIGNTTDNTWTVANSSCSVDNYSLMIADNGADCSYDNTIRQDIITYLPVNAVGHDSLVLSFNWKNMGETNFDFGSVWYSFDSINWQLIQTGGNGLGFYENSNVLNNTSLLLPDTLKNQLFYLGFNWNNDDNLGSNPGFVVDDIIITSRNYIAPTVTPPTPARPTCNWVGNTSIQWNELQNWDCGHLPLPTDNVFIPTGTTYQPLVVKPLNGTCYNLTVAAGTSLNMTSGSSLEVHGDIQSSSVLNMQDGIIYMEGDSVQHVTLPNGSSLHDVVINNQSDSGMVLNTNLTMGGLLSLMKGYIVTSVDTLILSNPYPTVPTIISYNNYSHVVGNLRRYVTPNYFGYDFPVGNIGDSSLHTATVLPQNLIGVNYLTASFKPLTNNDNRQLTAVDSGLPAYNKICTEGVWVIEPDNAPSTGSYDVKLSIDNINQLQDNSFAVLKRPVGSDASNWTTGGGTLPNDFDAGRILASGYAKRIGLSDFSEFAIARIDTNYNQVLMVGHYQPGRNIVILNWNDSTYNVRNTRVLRSLDGQNFIPVGGMVTTSGGSFKTSDDSPEKGIVFYQLEGLDKNGNTIHSDAIMVNCVGYADDDLIVYPNPNKGMLNFHMQTKESNIDIVVCSLNGDILYTYSTYNAGTMFDKQIDLTGKLAAGTYLVRVITPSESFFRKVSVVK